MCGSESIQYKRNEIFFLFRYQILWFKLGNQNWIIRKCYIPNWLFNVGFMTIDNKTIFFVFILKKKVNELEEILGARFTKKLVNISSVHIWLYSYSTYISYLLYLF